MEKKMDLRIQKTYLSLHQAFTELLDEKKFEDFTINELCERAMIRRTTFYKHFADKYEYFNFYLKEVCEDIQKEFTSDVPVGEINMYFKQMSLGVLRFMTTHQSFVDNILKSNMFSLLFDILTDLVQSQVYLALKKTDKQTQKALGDLEGFASFYAGGLLNALYYYRQKDTDFDETAFLKTLSLFQIKQTKG